MGSSEPRASARAKCVTHTQRDTRAKAKNTGNAIYTRRVRDARLFTMCL